MSTLHINATALIIPVYAKTSENLTQPLMVSLAGEASHDAREPHAAAHIVSLASETSHSDVAFTLPSNNV